MIPRVLYCDISEMRFDNHQDLHILLTDSHDGRVWHWNHKGMVGVLTLPVMRNAIAAWDAWHQSKNRRESIPKHVGRFFWGQTVSVQEAEKLAETGPSPETPGGTKTH